jgi:hypothetical protein
MGGSIAFMQDESFLNRKQEVKSHAINIGKKHLDYFELGCVAIKLALYHSGADKSGMKCMKQPKGSI